VIVALASLKNVYLMEAQAGNPSLFSEGLEKKS
jgi:hypothetical protein